LKTITDNNIYSLRDTSTILDIKQVEEAVEYLVKANRIDFYGVGASQVIAQDAQ
jgi:DNA-binding MurR/RpiR family transcriptional regulator